MKRALVLVFAFCLLGAVAGPAFAAETPTGYIEICKAANPSLNGQFVFSISNGGGSVSLAQGTCSAPIAVTSGQVTVTELGSTLGMNDSGATTSPSKEFLADPTVTAVGRNGAVAVSGSGFMRYVTVPAGSSADVVTVTFANTLVTGVVEVCKAVTDPALTGTWSFTVSGGNGFSTTTSTTVGNCSPPVTVPAGHFKVVEDGIQSVSAITATKTASQVNAATSVSLADARIVATVDAGDASKQTIVTYTNNLVRLKLCKVWNSNSPSPVATYPFTFSTSGAAGPNGPIGPASLAPGTMASPNCVVIGSYRAGTRVAITEGITPGTKVSSITSNQGIVPGSLSTPNRTVTVDLMAGETVVTFTDVPALNGWLKICKTTTLDTPVIPIGTVFTFTVAAVTGYPAGTTATVTVAAGAPGTTQCSAPIASKFDATWTVTEAFRANTFVTSIVAVPTWVVVDGVDTNQPVLSAVNLAARSANVTIGENNTTELTFTNKDPLPGQTPTPGSGGTSGGGTSVVVGPVAVVTPAAVVANTQASTAASTRTVVLKAQKVALLKKQLTALKVTEKKLVKAHAAAKTKVVKAAVAKKLAAIRASQRRITLQLQLLR